MMLTEIMPTVVRTSGFSLAYSLAAALFGGSTPAICTYLIHITGNKAMSGVWMSAAQRHAGRHSAAMWLLVPAGCSEAKFLSPHACVSSALLERRGARSIGCPCAKRCKNRKWE